jgi:MFS family permease
MTAHGFLPSDPPPEQGVKPPPGVQADAPEGKLPFPEPVKPHTPVKGAALALGLLLGINLFNYIDRQVLAANLPPIEKALLPPGGADNGKLLGWLTSAFMFSYMIFAPLFGWLADRVTRWHLIGIGVIVWTLASGASGLAGSYFLLLLTRCFVGVGEAAYGPTAPAVIADLYPEEKRGQVMAWFYVAIPVGSALGYVLGGAAGWPWSFYLVVPPGLALGVFCFFMPEPRRGQSDAPGTAVRKVTLGDYRRLFRNRSWMLNTLGMTAMTFAMGGLGAWAPSYVSGSPGGGELDHVNYVFGLIVVASGLGATILGGLVGDWLRPRFSGSYFLVSGTAMLVGFPLFLAVLYVEFPFAWVLMFMACFCLFFNTGPTNTILANVTHPSLRAPAFAVNILIIHALGDAISPLVIGTVADLFAVEGKKNLHAGFLCVSFMFLLAGVLWMIGARYLARDTANASRQLDD